MAPVQHSIVKNTALLLLFIAFLAGCATPYDTDPPQVPDHIEGMGVLVFTKIAGFRHPSIKDGIQAIQTLGATHNWTVVETDNGAAFNEDYLSHFDVVVWLNTTWDGLNKSQEIAFEAFIEAGGGYVGIHSAADTEHDWNWYGSTLLRTRFNNHPNFPNVRNADVIVEMPDHPATSGLPLRWNREDEWYNFKSNPRNHSNIKVLASLDGRSYDAGRGAMGDHPIIWCQELGEGRVLYSGLGHTVESYRDKTYRSHLAGAISWAGKMID